MEKAILGEGFIEHFDNPLPIAILPMTHTHVYSASGTKGRTNRFITVRIVQLKHGLLLLVTVYTAVNIMALIVIVIESRKDNNLLSPHKFVEAPCCY
jgi:hypothetical protein